MLKWKYSAKTTCSYRRGRRDPDREVVGRDAAIADEDAFGDENTKHKCLYEVGEDDQLETSLRRGLWAENSGIVFRRP
jgi:hypothetical protein